ncbi:hypothetical protein D9619_008415 [Psilocybe cf. subviscida]|uniref:Uncharacterized protein n=1 Tax=Psilocybe cf. subviscida TaxID=2480587 RepID=A0A8H5F182_9AGAR|nr:hypothetical protein D9619_008415 [Psilocybe cf. subviscida]
MAALEPQSPAHDSTGRDAPLSSLACSRHAPVASSRSTGLFVAHPNTIPTPNELFRRPIRSAPHPSPHAPEVVANNSTSRFSVTATSITRSATHDTRNIARRLVCYGTHTAMRIEQILARGARGAELATLRHGCAPPYTRLNLHPASQYPTEPQLNEVQPPNLRDDDSHNTSSDVEHIELARSEDHHTRHRTPC